MNTKERITRVTTWSLAIALLLSMFLLMSTGMRTQAAPLTLTDSTTVFVNELHYDNSSTDVDEAIEIAGPAGTDLAGWSLVLYNGNGGAVYKTVDLSGVIADQQGGYGTINYLISGIQNGSPDGFALVAPGDVVIQFLSYEGTFTASGGPADGLTSTDIGVSESSSTPAGHSLQLTGAGTVYEDFNWSGPIENTYDSINTDQTMGSAPPPTFDPLINEFVFNHDGTDTNEYVEIFGDAGTDNSAFTVLEIEGDSTKAGIIDGVFQVGITNSGGYWTTGFMENVIENGTVTLLLVDNFTGNIGDDLDTNNDGILDITPWDRIVDDVAVTDGGSGDYAYSTIVLYPWYDGFPYTPGGASRIPNSTDTNTIADWMRNDFHGAGLPGFVGSPVPGEAYNTPAEINEPVPPTVQVCGDPYTPIYEIQGSGSSSPIEGSIVSTEGVVTGDFQDYGQLGGFYIQDPVGDGDPATSDGIFVYLYKRSVSVGDLVRVTGEVKEYKGLTEISYVETLYRCDRGVAIDPTLVDLPVANLDYWETVESMLLTFPQTLSATETYDLGRYGQVALSVGGRLFNPTDIVEPGVDANNQQELNDRSRMLLDDGSSFQNPSTVPYLGPDNTLRLGDTATNLTGVLDQYYDYRLQPTQDPVFDYSNHRPAAPDPVGGTIKVATFNVYNYWTTLGERGADTEEELIRQTAKLVPAILGLDADIIGLQELENNGDVAIGALVDALNAQVGADLWAFIPEPAGIAGTNAIKVDLIYRTDRVVPVGDALADLDIIFDRPPVAQTFDAKGEIFTVVTNHFKSKGCYDAEGLDQDQGDGQACYNFKRTLQAEELLVFVSDLQVFSGDPDVVVLGDFNSYAMEDPIDVLETGLTNQTDTIAPDDSYSYVYFGQSGKLDYIFNTSSLDDRVTGIDIWHIDADEPRILDYNTEYNPPYLYQPDQYRSSDHDPVIVGICDLVPPSLEVVVSPDVLWPPNHKYVEVDASLTVSDNFDPNPAVTLVSVTSSEPDNGLGDGDTPNDIVIVDDFTFLLRAERSGTGDGRVYTITYQATDSCGNVTVVSAYVIVLHDKGDKNKAEYLIEIIAAGGKTFYLPMTMSK